MFQKHISPKTNALIAVIELRRLTQGNMSLEDFHAQCVKLIDESEFPNDARDRLLRDTLIHGISSDSSRTKIVKKGKDISLNDVLDICRTQVAVDQQMSCITPSKQISYLKYGNNKKAKPPPKAKPMTGHGTLPQGSKCFRCGKGTHQKDQKCPASDATCRHCGRKGHYEVICQQKLRQGNKGGNPWKSSSGGNPKKVHSLEAQGQPQGQSSDEFIDETGRSVYQQHMLRNTSNRNTSTMVEMSVGTHLRDLHSKLQLKCDTGADLSVINEDTYRSISITCLYNLPECCWKLMEMLEYKPPKESSNCSSDGMERFTGKNSM